VFCTACVSISRNSALVLGDSRASVTASRDRTETAKRMTSTQSRLLNVGARVCWRDDRNDQATVTETNWSGVALKWDNRSQQSVLHNDMQGIGIVSKK
jgi:hypothetical protein